jgi:hypothetical protein
VSIRLVRQQGCVRHVGGVPVPGDHLGATIWVLSVVSSPSRGPGVRERTTSVTVQPMWHVNPYIYFI